MARRRFFGIVDGKTEALGPAYSRAIRRAQTATWASVAKAEYEMQQRELKRHYLNSCPRSEKFTISNEGWLEISKLRQEHYLAGTRHPHKRTIDEVARHAPVSRRTFYSVLWQVLSPQTDLNTCMNTVSMFDEGKLDALVNNLLSGHPHNLIGHLADLNTTGALVAHIRLLAYEKEFDRAFDTGCALVQTLCYHAVSPLFTARAAMLWDLVSQGVLVGLRKDNLQFSRCSEGFLYFSEALWDRLVSAQALYGTRRMMLGPGFTWATIVDMNHECIRGFATPELDGSDLLQSFLDAEPPHRRATSKLEKDPLFLPVKP